MNSIAKKTLYWAPRLLCLAFALFLSLFAMDVFAEYQGWDIVVALSIHLVPVYIVVAVTALSWRREWIGAVLFTGLGLFYIIWTWGRFHWSAPACISGPLFLLGGLFWLGWVKRKELRGRNNTGPGIAVLLLSFLIFSSACAPWQVGAEKNVEKNGIRFETFKEEENGSKLGILASDTVIDGWPCKQGFIVFYPDWRLDELLLSEDYERNGISMPSGTWVFPNEQGNPGTCMFPRDMEIQGLICRGSRLGKEGMMTSFHANGKLKHFYAREQVEVDGVPCKGSIFSGISLHANGRLHQCVLAEAATIGGVRLSRGSTVQLDPGGSLVNDIQNRR